MTLSPGSLTYNDMIRYEVALVNEGLGGQAQARPLSYLGPEKVPTGDVGEAKVPDYPVADGSLARARGSCRYEYS